MQNHITYRYAVFDDLPFIVDVYNSTIASRMVTADTDTVSVESRLDWFHQHNNHHRPLWIIEYKGQPCGWVSLSSFFNGRPAYDKTAEISLYLHQDFRGKKIAQYIVKEIEASCPSLNIETVVSFVFGHNQPSLALFKKLGYEQWGYLPAVAELDHIKRDLVILGKKV